MRILIEGPNGLSEAADLSFQQSKQAAAIMDCVGRLIPQEGVDYDVDVILQGQYSPSVSMNIVPHTDKGVWWRRYVSEMIKKYPPSVENPKMAIEEQKGDQDEENVS